MGLSDCSASLDALDASRFSVFVEALTQTIDAAAGDEARILHEGAAHVTELVSHDDWLPAKFADPVPGAYGQYLLYCDPRSRFTTVAFVWDAGSSTPIHDHTVWGIIGVLRGAEIAERFVIRSGKLCSCGEATLRAGEVDRVSPRIGDVHRVRNAYADRSSISIHVYGADLCKVERHTYCPDTGRVERIVSKPYDNPAVLARHAAPSPY